MVNELAAVMKELGGAVVLGRSIATAEDMSSAIREGFSHDVVTAFLQSSGLTLQEVASSLDLSLRSLQRRRQEGRLARFESDRLYRLARLMALAEYYLGDHRLARDWFKRANHALGGAVPLNLVDTELGAREVEAVLGRAGYGGVS